MGWTDEKAFRTAFIEYVHHPDVLGVDLPVVKRFQNLTQPVDVFGGESMMDIHIERVEKVGTDQALGWTDEGNSYRQWYRGDRIVHASMEYYGEEALTRLTHLRDITEMPSVHQRMVQAGFSEIRDDENEPYSTTRTHKNTKFIESAEYVTRYNMSVDYFVDVDTYEEVEIDYEIANGVKDIAGSITITKP